MKPTQTAITGNEQGLPDGPLAALSEFYRAFNGRNLDAVAVNWADSGDIAMDNPLGGIKRGREEIMAVYSRIFGGAATVYVEFYDYTIHECGEMFYAVGRERGSFTKGDVKIDLAIRTSRIFQKMRGRWYQVHHHGSIETPQLLETYQKAVAG